MIKSDIQITETAMNLPQVNLRSNLNSVPPTTETKIENPLVEKISENLAVKTHFTRLKRRLRCRPTSIF